jgi:putative heme iron utilization protein
MNKLYFCQKAKQVFPGISSGEPVYPNAAGKAGFEIYLGRNKRSGSG